MWSFPPPLPSVACLQFQGLKRKIVLVFSCELYIWGVYMRKLVVVVVGVGGVIKCVYIGVCVLGGKVKD